MGYAVRASPPANYGKVIQGVTRALEELGEALRPHGLAQQGCRRGNFKTVSFGCSYGGGQGVS